MEEDMHRQLDWRLWTVLGVGLTSACLHGPSNAQVVRERMAEESVTRAKWS